MSPNAMSEDDRRELIARQHRALYGENSSLYEGGTRQSSQDARVATSLAGRGPSPLAFDPFGMQSGGDPAVQMPARDGKDAGAGAQRSRANSTSSPSSNHNGASFSLFDNAQQSSRTSNSSPTGGSPPRGGLKSGGSAGVAPIGTRPTQASGQAANPALNKRSTTPLPSPLSFGFTASDPQGNERSASTSSNPASSVADKGGVAGLGWGSNSGVWGSSKSSLGVQASVWG